MARSKEDLQYMLPTTSKTTAQNEPSDQSIWPRSHGHASLAARLGGLAYRAKYGDDIAYVGQEGLLKRFANEVDPNGLLDDDERSRRAIYRRRQHMNQLALLSAAKRKQKSRTLRPSSEGSRHQIEKGATRPD